MSDRLLFHRDRYEIKEYNAGGRSIRVRAYIGLDYCADPKDAIQKMNIFVPEAYYSGQKTGPYGLENAPVFMPNTVGGYMPGPAEEPGADRRSGEPNTIFRALEHGYVAVSAGVRGRTTGKESKEFFEGSSADGQSSASGKKTGRAPAFIVDYKAAIRYLRHNRGLIPGDVEKIITNGTSAGGALSALAGSSGNNSDYEPYLGEIGAAEERDDIFAASCYCPIHNLENADAAYEWQFCGQDTYHHMRFVRTPNGIRPVEDTGALTDEQIRVSSELKKLFPGYLNSLNLKDAAGNDLALDDNGEGSFLEEVKAYVISAAEKAMQSRQNGIPAMRMSAPGSDVMTQDYLVVNDGHITGIDWDRYMAKITRMKTPPAFDALDLSTGENEEFGDEKVDLRHFTRYSYENTHFPGTEMANKGVIDLMNPISQILSGKSDVTKHWRIRHGTFDRDTSLAIPVVLATLLRNRGYDVDFSLPWGLPHSGDYDLDELFSWIDGLVSQE